MPINNPVQKFPVYVVKNLQKSTPPANSRGNDWYRYVIEGARSQIVGYTHGSLQQVTQNVEDFAAKANARNAGKNIYPWTPRKRWQGPEAKG